MPTEFLIIGLGSAGQRHARVIRKLYPGCKIFCLTGDHPRSLIADNLKSQSFSIDPIDYYHLTPIQRLDELKYRNISLSVLANPPSHRSQNLQEIETFSERILIEKPLALNPSEAALIIKLLESSNKPAWVGYQNYFNPLQVALSEHFTRLDSPSEIKMLFHEDLQSMNPFRDMSEHHLAKKEGGGVFLGLSHELMFLYNLFENVSVDYSKSYMASSGRFPSVFDNAEIIAHGNRGTSNSTIRISLSLSPEKNFRGGVIRSGNSTINWDFNLQEISVGAEHSTEQKMKYPHKKDDLVEAQLKFLMKSAVRSSLQEKNLADGLRIIEVDYILKSNIF